MKKSFSCRVGPCLFAALCLLLAGRAAAQVAELEPRWLRLDIPQMSLGMEAEGLVENVRSGGSNSKHEQLSLVPLVGLRTQGSIYHPNLISFDLDGESGWGWITDRIRSPGSNTSRDEQDELLRYLAQVSVLPAKPYNATFSASQDHTYLNYDSFNSYTVDTTRYTGRFGWTTETLELSTDLGYRDERSSGITGSSEITETYLNFYGTQKRQRGTSTLTYLYDEFDNSVNAGTGQNSTYHSVGVSDSETFGSRRQINATTSGGYSQSQYSGQQTETITATENITVEHSPRLESYLTANFSHSSLSPVDSSILQGVAGVRHRLYDSLTSTLDTHGSYDETSGSSSSAYNDRFGLGLQEDYTKRLGGWGRLSLGGGIIGDHEDHDSSGAVLTTIDEPHVISSSQPFYLKQPRVLVSTIEVRKAGGPPVPMSEYQIIPAGELTGIQLLLGGTNGVPILKDGDAVLVSYQSDSLYNASFESFTGNAEVRLDLFDKYGIYGRVNWLDNNAPPEALAQTLTDLVGGMDYTWRWFRASAEYENYDSNFSKYQVWRGLQSFNYQPSSGSTYGVDISQSFYRYPGGLNQDQYQILARYNTQLAFSLAWHVEGGYALLDVVGGEQDYSFARTGLSWSRGKLSVRAGYEYNYQTTTTASTTEYRDRHHFFTYLKRTF